MIGICGSDLSCDEPGRIVRKLFFGMTRIELAAELRKRTAVSMGWIAKELNAGVPNSVWNAMRRLQVRGELGKRE